MSKNPILEARQRRGLTQRQLADAMAVSVQAVSQWETGKAQPSINRLRTLAKVLYVELSSLAGDTRAVPDAAPRVDGGKSAVPVFLEDNLPSHYIVYGAMNSPDPESIVSATYPAKGLLTGVKVTRGRKDRLYDEGDILIFDNGVSPAIGDLVIFVKVQVATGKEDDVAKASFQIGMVCFTEDLMSVPLAESAISKHDVDTGKPSTKVLSTLVERRLFPRDRSRTRAQP